MAYPRSASDQDRDSIQRADRILDEGLTRSATPQVNSEFRETVVVLRDRVRWGPIAAGAAVGLAIALLLSLLRLAIGAAAFEPGTDTADWSSWAGVWGAITAVAAFFVAVRLAARTAAVIGPHNGLVDGIIAGTVTHLLMLWLTIAGVTNFLGFLGTDISGIAHVVILAPGERIVAAEYDKVDDAAWGTLIVTAFALGAAALGGIVGSHDWVELAYRRWSARKHPKFEFAGE
jgi:hypothetical protein